MSKELSGTWNASRHVAEKLGERTGKKITVIDSAQLSGSLGLMVLRAAEAIAAGLPHDEIVSLIKQWQEKACILVSVKDLKYMIRGGRVSPMKGRIANLLNLTPIISLNREGKSVLYDKAFSQKGNMKKVMKIIAKKLRQNRLWKYSLLHAHDPGRAEWYAGQLTPLLGKEPDFVIDISPVVGLSAGHGALAVALMLE
jgi:DegV family protein with EDD domain